LKPNDIAHKKGASVALFFDSKTHQYIEEFGTSNFVAISKDGAYVTPDSSSILQSITNLSLMEIAEKDFGMKVERRAVHKDELEEFAEVGACGTAVVVTPMEKIISESKTYVYGSEIGPVLKKLYDRMTGIQFGELPDEHGWLVEVKA
jgi:branched-chain amino acid aminotransferase